LGSRVEGLQGVVAYSYNEYRLIATNEVNNTNFVTSGEGFDVARKDAPAIADSDLRIASFNVLNYFNSVADSGHENPTGQNRGATNLDEFLTQQAKIVAAMNKMDADVIGLMEVENNGFGDGSAIQNLVDALNAEIDDAEDHYTYVEIEEQDKYQDEYFGSDAIMVAILYRANAVTP
ncbi:nuclease, partial [Vibrio parahaemolyticus]|nr:nuclease [Vibrio parahaemolyticus]